MVSQLNRIPPEKRKSIVLFDRHMNEGTALIAKRHHEEWEKHGTVAIRIPPQWTPHGYYSKVIRKEGDAFKIDRRRRGAILRNFRNDPELANELFKRGFKVPIIHLHGTPSQLWGTPDISASLLLIANKENILPAHPSFLYRSKLKFDVHSPNMLTAEFVYKKEKWRENPQLFDRVEKLRLREDNQRQLATDYLMHPIARREDVDRFSAEYAHKFESVLKFLSKKGLQMPAAERQEA